MREIKDNDGSSIYIDRIKTTVFLISISPAKFQDTGGNYNTNLIGFPNFNEGRGWITESEVRFKRYEHSIKKAG